MLPQANDAMLIEVMIDQEWWRLGASAIIVDDINKANEAKSCTLTYLYESPPEKEQFLGLDP